MTTLPQTTSIQLPRPAGSSMITPSHPMQQMPSQGGPQMTGGDIWRVIRTNIWLIAGSLVLSIIIGFALNWVLAKYYPRYTAMGFIQVQAGRKYPLLDRNMQGMFDTVTADALAVEQKTQVQGLSHDSLYTEVLKNKQEIRKTEWFAQFTKPDKTVALAAALYDLSKHFSAGAIQESKLIQVSMTYTNPADCKVIVLDIVDQYLDAQQKLNMDSMTKQTLMLNNQKSRYEGNINSLRRELTSLAIKLNLDGFRPGTGPGTKDQELALLITKKMEADADFNEAKAAFDGAQSAINSGETPGMVESMVDQNQIIAQLKWRLSNSDIAISARKTLAPDSRELKDMISERDAVASELQQMRDAERVTVTAGYIDQLKGRLQATQANLKNINDSIEITKASLSESAAAMAEYLTKKDEQKAYEELLSQTRDKVDTLNAAMQQLDMNSVTWYAKPETPLTPSFPKLGYTLSVCILLGLGLSLGISFLREVLDTSVRSPRDIARVGQMTLLGMIPDEMDDPQASGIPLPTVIYAAPTSMLAEQFRQVRTRLQHAASLDTTRSILVTSPSPGDGKSTVACNLAAGLALNGRRILLVDANFRRPELHKIFGVPNEAGFGNVLSSVEHFESTVRQTRVPNLDLITTGPKPANATELLESQLLIDFIERALEEYDHIIFDSGPMLVVSETVALAPRVDGVVTVVRAKANSRGLLQRMRDGLRQLKAEHLGVVLNGVRATGGGYYGRNIKTYYEYQNGPGNAA